MWRPALGGSQYEEIRMKTERTFFPLLRFKLTLTSVLGMLEIDRGERRSVSDVTGGLVIEGNNWAAVTLFFISYVSTNSTFQLSYY